MPEPLRQGARFAGSQRREWYACGQRGGTQTLSPTAILRVGGDVSQLTGFQANPYRTVFVAGQYLTEQHPDSRIRVAVFARLNKFFPAADASAWLSYRVYADDWGILSHTFGATFFQNIGPRLRVRYRYRFYGQTGADFYEPEYPLVGEPTFYTADYKLMLFTVHLYGFKVDHGVERLSQWFPAVSESALEFKYERYFNTNDFAANILQFGLRLGY